MSETTLPLPFPTEQIEPYKCDKGRHIDRDALLKVLFDLWFAIDCGAIPNLVVGDPESPMMVRPPLIADDVMALRYIAYNIAIDEPPSKARRFKLLRMEAEFHIDYTAYLAKYHPELDMRKIRQNLKAEANAKGHCYHYLMKLPVPEGLETMIEIKDNVITTKGVTNDN